MHDLRGMRSAQGSVREDASGLAETRIWRKRLVLWGSSRRQQQAAAAGSSGDGQGHAAQGCSLHVTKTGRRPSIKEALALMKATVALPLPLGNPHHVSNSSENFPMRPMFAETRASRSSGKVICIGVQ